MYVSAIEFSGQSVDELPFGSPERVCEHCSSSKLKKQKQGKLQIPYLNTTSLV